MTFAKVHWPAIAKIVVAVAPILGLSGLAYDQNQELKQLRTTVVIEQEPIEVKIEQPVTVNDKKHTHPELKQIDKNESNTNKNKESIEALRQQLKELTRWQ